MPADTYFDKFPQIKNISFNTFITLDSAVAAEALFIDDTSIIVANTKKLLKGWFFYEYSLATKKPTGKYIKWGAKKNMTLSPMSYGLYRGNMLWVHDIALKKMIIAPLQHKLSFDSISGMEDYKMPDFSYSVQLMDSNRVLKSGIYHTPAHLQVSELINNNPVRAIGNFEIPGNSLPLNTWKAAYEGFLFLQPSETKAVVACRYSDRIQIFNLKTQIRNTISGPDQFEPKFVALKDAEFSIGRTNKTRFAFLGGAVTEKHIYLLYSGKTQESPGFQVSDRVFVYNWSGEPVKCLLLDRYVSGITVPENEEAIYALDVKTDQVIKSAL